MKHGAAMSLDRGLRTMPLGSTAPFSAAVSCKSPAPHAGRGAAQPRGKQGPLGLAQTLARAHMPPGLGCRSPMPRARSSAAG